MRRGVTDIVGLASTTATAMALIVSDTPTAPGEEPKLQPVAQIFPNRRHSLDCPVRAVGLSDPPRRVQRTRPTQLEDDSDHSYR